MQPMLVSLFLSFSLSLFLSLSLSLSLFLIFYVWLSIFELGFDLLDKPEKASLVESLKQLYFLDALNEKGVLTAKGKQMSAFPVQVNHKQTKQRKLMLIHVRCL